MLQIEMVSGDTVERTALSRDLGLQLQGFTSWLLSIYIIFHHGFLGRKHYEIMQHAF